MHKALIVFGGLAAVALALLGSYGTAQGETATAPVVFVCEHGNVKSLIGASLFNRIAKERGLPFHAVARGVAPEESVPPKIVYALRGDGVEVAGFKPERLSSQDVSTAYRTVGIGVDLSAFSAGSHAPIERWDDVPPASVDYAASRAALLRHIEVLLDQLWAKR
ncbi:MAG TPA: hypothetical protein VH988_15260 [Thermoanaerobaculia bacterium]|jgi:protein-tyrosine-phosphatase|nr:hypothetical protein [Thermoanaerobaculia bacterium]